MSRRHSAKKREVLPDPKFNNLIVTKFINTIMQSGKKSVAEKIVYGAFEIVQTKTKTDPLAFFMEVLDKVKPSVEVKSRRRWCDIPGSSRSSSSSSDPQGNGLAG
jgi:small subunit ribosomal protein S7